MGTCRELFEMGIVYTEALCDAVMVFETNRARLKCSHSVVKCALESGPYRMQEEEEMKAD